MYIRRKTILWLGANVVSSSPAARQYFFIYINIYIYMSERNLEGGASRVRVTSSDDSRVDRFACAGSPSSSSLFLRMVRWRDG